MIVVLVPSRARPGRAASMAASVLATAARPDDVRVHLLVDDDDPTLAVYADALAAAELPAGDVLLIAEPRLGYTGALNRAAMRLWDEVEVLAAFGDDVVFRTFGWDDRVREALATPGMAYGDDLIHGRNHPSAVFMSSAIARALGWLALPATTHQWADDAWKQLGQLTGCLRFLEGVVVEHEHPAVGKAEWDETYAGVFDDERAKNDYEGFLGWVESGGLLADADRIRSVL